LAELQQFLQGFKAMSCEVNDMFQTLCRSYWHVSQLLLFSVIIFYLIYCFFNQKCSQPADFRKTDENQNCSSFCRLDYLQNVICEGSPYCSVDLFCCCLDAVKARLRFLVFCCKRQLRTLQNEREADVVEIHVSTRVFADLSRWCHHCSSVWLPKRKSQKN